ncbi:MAG TPA: RNA-binding protein [Vicinamibacterales bacterium]|nr:RNA-binding protein [Vicinamibacterales bacterium]
MHAVEPSDSRSGWVFVRPSHVAWVAETSQESVMGRKLYVGNLPYETNEQDLQELFTQAGNVETVTVMRDRDTGRARGFAFVEMSSDDEAQNAITKLNDQQFGGRRLTVNEARPQVPRSGGGGGGGGAYGSRGPSRRSEPRW